MRHVAAREQESLVIGVDANADALRDTSRRLASKPARGGLPNALLGRLALADAPGELEGFADALTVLLPWGSLLRALARPEPAALGALRRICKSGARLDAVFGYGEHVDGTAIRDLALPPLGDQATLPRLVNVYRDAGFAVSARDVSRDEVRDLPTTWARKLAYSGHERRFVALGGRAE